MNTYTKYTYLTDSELLVLVAGDAVNDPDYARELAARLELRTTEPVPSTDYRHYGVKQ